MTTKSKAGNRNVTRSGKATDKRTQAAKARKKSPSKKNKSKAAARFPHSTPAGKLNGGGGLKAGMRPSAGEAIEISSTEAQNNFGLLLDQVARDHPVFIRRRDTRQAVMISVERYEALTRTESPALDTLTGEFDALFERMQSVQARSAAQSLFTATPDELGRAALEAARPGSE